MSAPAATRHASAEEPVRGLPGPLPAGETVLWQGAPSWRGLALRAFHLRAVALYFAAILALRLAAQVSGGEPVGAVLASTAWLTLLPLVALLVFGALACLSARATVYTITDRRVVMRIGVALPIVANVPFGVVESAGLRVHADGTGDIPLALKGDDRFGYVHLWPHARPWRFAKPEPMLRAVPDAAAAADVLARALAAAAGTQPVPVRAAAGVQAGASRPAFGGAPSLAGGPS